MEHDALFKQLLSEFFFDFLTLFLPDVAAYIDPASLAMMDKEILTDIAGGDRREVDLLAQARFREQDAFFLIHLENQSVAQPEFAMRMFFYFARLHEKYKLPVYPVVIFSYDKPKRAEPSHYKVVFPDKAVLQFEYTVIQLNRIPWRTFIQRSNPVATALMAKMAIPKKDRPLVRLEYLRMLATLKLDPARSALIWAFAEKYLQLNAQEMAQFEREYANFSPEEKEATMKITTPWHEEGEKIGRQEIVTLLINERFGSPSERMEAQIRQLTSAQLDDLAKALLKFDSLADLQKWLER